MNSNPPAPDSLRKIIHDLNQAIFLIRGNCELAKSNSPDPEKLGEFFREMEIQMDDLATLAKQLKQKQLELAPEE
jgi:hypothetical protein